MLTHVAGALDGLRVGEVITDVEYDDWMGRTRKAARVTYAGGEEAQPAGGGLQAGWVGGSAQAVPSSLLHKAPRFLRTITGPDEDRPFYAGRLRMPALDLYDSHMVLHWRVTPLHNPLVSEAEDLADADRDSEGLPEREREGHRQMERLRSMWDVSHHFVVSDDVGTGYHRSQSLSEAGSSDDERVGHVVLRPSAPESASQVTVEAAGNRFPFRLQRP
jgi:hypothetical protein